MLDKRFIDELRGRLTLSEIIGRKIKLTRAGREFKACCPFHGEKTPSFYINDAKGFFHCFGCGVHGDAVSFRMKHDNLSFMEAIESLAPEAGLDIPTPDPQTARKFDEFQRLFHIMDRVAKWFEAQLTSPSNAFALRYLKERGLTEDTIARFRLGYAPNNWDELREAMLAAGFKAQDLVMLGILKHSSRADKADKPYSFFRGRIIFPVTDVRGRVIAFGGRHLDAAFTDQTLPEKPPKYINSAEQPLFNKSSVLYGMAQARAHISKENSLILVEGYMDVIALSQAGFVTTVAPLGTALTEEHMQLAWKVSSAEATPFLCFDGDNAGQNAAYRAIERLLPFFSAQKNVNMVFIPRGEDPDSLIRKQGPQALRALLSQATGVFDTLWNREIQHAPATPEARASLQARLDETIQQISDPLLQKIYRQSLRDRMFHLGRNNFSKSSPARGGNKKAIFTGPKVQLPVQDNGERAWKALLATTINHPSLLEKHIEELSMASIPHRGLEPIREALVHFMHTRNGDSLLTSDNIKQSLSKRGIDDMVANLLNESTYRLDMFAGPDATIDKAQEGWNDAWKRLHIKSISDENNKLLQGVRYDFDETAEQHFASLQQISTLIDETP